MEILQDRVKTEVFEGPLDLLLDLIDKNEIDLADIPISIITEQYINYLYVMGELDIALAGEFVVVAAQLIEIKAKMMLPVDEDEPVEDPRAELAKRLGEYKIYKLISEYIKSKEPHYNSVVSKEPSYYSELENDYIPPDINTKMLFSAMQLLIKKHEIRLGEVFSYSAGEAEVPVEARIEFILDCLITDKKVSFLSLFNSDKSKANIISTLLALLELIKSNLIEFSQQEIFEDIIITRTDVSIDEREL